MDRPGHVKPRDFKALRCMCTHTEAGGGASRTEPINGGGLGSAERSMAGMSGLRQEMAPRGPARKKASHLPELCPGRYVLGAWALEDRSARHAPLGEFFPALKAANSRDVGRRHRGGMAILDYAISALAPADQPLA